MIGNNEPETVTLRREGAVAWVTLNRPEKRNAMHEPMMRSLLSIIAELREDAAIGVVVLSAQGGVFSGGIDLNSTLAQRERPANPFDGYRSMTWQHQLIAQLVELPQVTIAAIQGPAVGGGGFGLAMACDLRYATANAQFWMVPTSLNEVQDFGLTWLLQRCAGDAKTLEWVLTGEAISAAEALAHGVLHGVCEDEEALLQLVRQRCEAFTRTTPDIIKLQKFSAAHGSRSSLRDQLETEALMSALCFTTDEFAQALAALRSRLGKS